MLADAPRDRPTVLVVEDDRTLARGLVMNLELEGFRVLHAADGNQGLELALAHSPDLVVLDLMLPGLTGFEVVAELRQRERPTPVLVLSARGEIADKVEALRLGADDYLTKPFSLKELVARIRARLRRPTWTGSEARPIVFGDVTVDLERRAASRAGRDVTLTQRELDLLVFLVTHPRRVFSREQLVDALWSSSYEGTARTVDNFLHRLRTKLEEDPTHPRHFMTVRGRGYCFDP
ncbi:MAG: response regulator transcription factor [Myxococcota bacterium]